MRKIRINSFSQKSNIDSFYELNSDLIIDLEKEGFIPTTFSDIYPFNKRKKKRKL